MLGFTLMTVLLWTGCDRAYCRTQRVNVNVIHLIFIQNAYGQYRLSGNLIGTADTLSFLVDLLKDIDIPLSIECDKNK
ncbi:hypothetical protein CRI94_11715 [Longibacter salinarum]|uniref:Uncharacterized protein n=1 Tax=Longibacter salinarum TaxID=1850348 RepID=A0A2A8CY38_9BACT|nr:hypothetical protein CRI94_11715 [Longibacter salinarum]